MSSEKKGGFQTLKKIVQVIFFVLFIYVVLFKTGILPSPSELAGK